MRFADVRFLTSVHSLKGLPEPLYPEVAFAGRSNVGKSSLINTVLGRKNLVKTSAKPGKTQGLNFFIVDERLYLVDLPGYGFARVSKDMQSGWQQLITEYLLHRTTLKLVVVIIDIRHPLKTMDKELVDWLQHHKIPFLPIYTKADKLSRNRQLQQAVALDVALGLISGDRLIFSSKSGQGRQELLQRLAIAVESCYGIH